MGSLPTNRLVGCAHAMIKPQPQSSPNRCPKLQSGKTRERTRSQRIRQRGTSKSSGTHPLPSLRHQTETARLPSSTYRAGATSLPSASHPDRKPAARNLHRCKTSSRPAISTSHQPCGTGLTPTGRDQDSGHCSPCYQRSS